MKTTNLFIALAQVAVLTGALSACAADEQGAEAVPPVDNAEPSQEGYAVGDIYDDGEFRAEYLGLALLKLGAHSTWTDGECYAFLVEVTRYNDHLNSGGTDTFNPSTRGILPDGSETERDGSGVGCDSKPLREAGYQRTHKARLKVGESARVWTGAFHLPAASGALQGVQLHGSSALFEPDITLDTTQAE